MPASSGSPQPRILVADPRAVARRRLARDVLDGGFAVLTAPDRAAAAAILGTTRIHAALCTAGLFEPLAGVRELAGSSPDVPVLLALPQHQLAETAAELRGAVWGLVPLPVFSPSWLHGVLDAAVARSIAAVELREARQREHGRVVRKLVSLPYRAGKQRLLEQYDAAYVDEVLPAATTQAAGARRAGLSASSFRRLCQRVRDGCGGGRQ